MKLIIDFFLITSKIRYNREKLDWTGATYILQKKRFIFQIQI